MIQFQNFSNCLIAPECLISEILAGKAKTSSQRGPNSFCSIGPDAKLCEDR